MEIREMKEKLEGLTKETRDLLGKNDAENAKKKMEEVRALKESIKMAEELEEEEKRDLQKQKEKQEAEKRQAKNTKEEKRGNGNMDKNIEMRSAVKYMLGKKLTEEERDIVKSQDNQAILPKQFIKELELIESGYGCLEKYVHVIPVTKNEGSKPIFEPDDTELDKVAEGDTIGKAGLKTSDMKFKCSKVGVITELSSELVDDAEEDVEYLAKEQFTVKNVTTKNVRICNVLKNNCELVTGTSYKDINKVMDVAKPAVKNGLKTFTNELGYAYLKGLEDKQGRNLNLVTEMNGKYMFNAKELVVTDSKFLPSEDGKVDFYTCNPKEMIKMFKRKNTTIAKEKDFNTDTNMLRVLNRFDIEKAHVRDAKHMQIPTA